MLSARTMSATLLVSKYMTRAVRTLDADAKLAEAHRLLREHSFSALVVTGRDGRPAGVISRTDLLRVGRSSGRQGRSLPLLELPDQAVRAVMSAPAASIGEEATLREAAGTMLRHRYHRLVVLDAKGHLAGVLSTKDLMAAVHDQHAGVAVGDFMTAPALTVDALDTVAHATDKLTEAHVAGLVVLEDERPVGMFTQTEALQARDEPSTTPVGEVMSYAMLCLDRKVQLRRAAGHALTTRARRIVVVDHREVCGVVTGMDFARALLAGDG